MPDALVVIAAPNGARLDKQGHPAVPLTAIELAECAESLVDAGVSVLHLHVRDEAGRHVLDAGRYREAMAEIRRRVGDALVLQVTTEAVGRYDRAEQMRLVADLEPEAVSLALRELCPDAEAEPGAKRFFRELHERGVWAQYILYTPDEVRRFESLRRAGAFGTRRPFALFVLGRYSESLHGDPAELDGFLAAADTAAFPWAVCCFGADEARAMRRAAESGGHLRIGFENNRVLPGGGLARDNAQLVVAELEYLRQSGAPARPIATAAWVRSELAGVG